MLTLPFLPQSINLNLILKIPLLILIGLYAVFIFMLLIRLNALNRIVFFPSRTWSLIIRIFGYIYFLLILSLFLTTLVIV